MSTVKRVLAELKMESRSDINAAIITAIMRPRKPTLDMPTYIHTYTVYQNKKFSQSTDLHVYLRTEKDETQ